MTDDEVINAIATTLRTEGEAVLRLVEPGRIADLGIAAACRQIHAGCHEQGGRLVITGVGKAGLIGRKLAATFASTGTPALALHPTDALHGDLGMVTERDTVLAMSNSGSSNEVVALIPALRRIGPSIIAMVGDGESQLAQLSDLVINYGAVTEACPLGLAPSTSTTVMLAIGDALALAVQKLRDFTPEQYARFHPGGALGRKLMTCAEAMRSGDRVPVVGADTPIIDCIRAISEKRAGCALIGEAGILRGIFTDGDLRRALSAGADANGLLSGPVSAHATMPCKSVHGGELVQQALGLCARYHIDEIPVVDGDGRILGLLDAQDLADRGFAV